MNSAIGKLHWDDLRNDGHTSYHCYMDSLSMSRHCRTVKSAALKEVRNTATNRELVYLPVTADIKESVSKIASLSGKAEGEVYLEAIGAKVDPDVIKVNLQRMKLESMAAFMGLDVDTIAKLINRESKTDSDKVKK